MTLSSTIKLDSIYVLNVKKFSRRRQLMEDQLKRNGLQAEFIFDWDVEDLNEVIESNYFSPENDLTVAQKSCALKHVTALQKIAASNHKLNLVLEDDAVFSDNFSFGLAQAIQESSLYDGDKIIFIGSGGNFYTPKSQRKPGQHLYVGTRNRLADSYIIDCLTANKRLTWIENNKITLPIDDQFETIDKALGIAMYWLEDPIVEQGSKNGLFRSSLEMSPPKWLKKIFFNWEKLKRKHIYQLWR